MGVHKLFLDKPCEGKLGKSTEYQYEDGVLELRWRGERSWHPFPERSAVVVKCLGGTPEVEPLAAPRSYRGKILWLCGVPKNCRCKTLEEYDALVDKHQGGPLRHEGNPNWHIARALDQEGRDYIVAGWVSPSIPDKQLRRMLRNCGAAAPDWYIREILKKDWA